MTGSDGIGAVMSFYYLIIPRNRRKSAPNHWCLTDKRENIFI